MIIHLAFVHLTILFMYIQFGLGLIYTFSIVNEAIIGVQHTHSYSHSSPTHYSDSRRRVQTAQTLYGWHTRQMSVWEEKNAQGTGD